MDIEIPPWLQWVSYLAGDTWPQGSETGMVRINEFFDAAARELDDLLPDLNRVRGETLSVLFGDTAQAADEQFRMLFDGDYAVDKLSDATRALGESAGFTGSEIEYSKLSIIVGLALAAAEISWALSMSGPTWGASTAAIPGIEWATITTFRQLVAAVLRQVRAKVRDMLTRTTVKQLIREGLKEAPKEAGQEMAMWATQEGIVYRIQGDRYHVNGERLLLGGVASTVGGGAGGATAVPVSSYLGPAATRGAAARKGATTFFTAGVVGNLAGTASVGGNPFADPMMMLASSTTSSVGGLRGAGVSPGHADNTSNGQQQNPPPPGAQPPHGPQPDPQPDGPQSDGPQSDETNDDSESTQPEPQREPVNDSNNHGQDPHSDGARISDSPTDESAAAPHAAHTNEVAHQSDESTTSATPTNDHESSTDNGETQTAQPSPQPADNGEQPTQSPDGATLIGADTAGDGSGHDPIAGTPVTDTTPPDSQNGLPVDDRPADVAQTFGPDRGPESVVAQPTTDQSDTMRAIADTAAVAEPASPATTTPTAPTSGLGTPPIATSAPPPSSPTTAASVPSDTSAPQPSTRTPTQSARTGQETSRDRTAPDGDQPVPGGNQPAADRDQPLPDDAVAAPQTAAASISQPPVTPVAGPSDPAAMPTEPSTAQPRTEQSAKEPPGPNIVHRIVIPSPPTTSTQQGGNRGRSGDDCLDRVAKRLSEKYGRPIHLAELPSAQGTPASLLFQAVGSGADFATYAQVEEVLGRMEPGSAAIVTSAWAGGPRRGGHAYLAVNDNGRVYLEDPDTGERTPWPPGWGQDAVLRSAVGYLDPSGNAVQPLNDTRQLVAAAAVGPVRGHPADDGSTDGDRAPGDRWRDVVPHSMVADAALERRGVQSAAELRNPLGLMEAACQRSQHNASWWDSLTGAEQRALIETYPQHIGNAEGIPAGARDTANRLALEQDRRELQARHDRGERLTRTQRKQLARLDRINTELARAQTAANDAGVGGPLLIAFDPMAFGGDGRAVVAFGSDRTDPDPYRAESVSWHVPGQGMTIDQIGRCMGDALNHLQSTLHEDSDLNAASIAWIGYDTPSGLNSWRAAGHKFAREGAAILYSDIRAFNTARDARAPDGTPHFTNNHIFAHSYGSTTASYAGRDGRLENDIRTVSLIGSAGAGPLQHADEFGSDVDVYVASSSRDPFTALGGRTPGSLGRIFGRGLGVDPAMESFGAQRVTAEFSADMDRRRNWGTHNAYYRYVDRTTDPPMRSESLANFGRIAAGRSDRLDFETHRTVDERPGRLFGTRQRTVEPAAGRPLSLDGDTEQSPDRETRRLWNPRWRGQPAEVEGQHTEVASVDSSDNAPAELSPADVAKAALEERGVGPDGLVSPADHRVAVSDAVDRANANAEWWKGLSENQQQALIRTYPHEIGNAEGISPLARHEANSIMLQRWLAHRDILVSRRDNGVALNAKQEQFIDLMNDIESALRSAERNAQRANVGGPYLLALDPRAFDGAGRAIVSFGADPYTAKSVSWYVPGMTTTIEKMRAMMLRGFNQLQSTLRENQDPDFTAASITYIGYKAPGSWDPRVGFQKMAREGGQIFCSDMLAFNAGRDVFTGDGSHFSNNHVFAHSYGSVTVSHAGHGERLANDIRTVTLIGSPGAGPLHHARDFGIGEENVFVASSSRDRTTGLGGDRPGERGRTIRRMGQGIDPAMDSFGAHRITAEFPAALDHMGRGSRMTHSLYWAYMDPGLNPRVRSESLVNFGRIAAGRADHVDTEAHRTLRERQRWLRKPVETTFEPARGRPLNLIDDSTTHHPINRRHFWNPRMRRDIDCGHGVINELSAMHPHRDVRLDAVPSPSGVPARTLFEAIGSSSRFASYADVERTLLRLGDGASALLASRWRGWRQGGHAYLAHNVDGEIHLFDPHRGEWSRWPPAWSESAIRRTAVGYLDRHGEPIDPYDGSSRHLAAAAFVGRVQGLPDSALIADAALGDRGIRADDLVNPLGSPELAVERARSNATWWDGLTDRQKQGFVDAHPDRIGNAEGIRAAHRDAANREYLRQLRERADHIQTKLDQFEHVSNKERKFLERVNQIDLAVRKADADAAWAGLDRPLVLALDLSAFGGGGRAVLSFGADPYHADNVSWHTARENVKQLGTAVRPALDQLRSILQQNRSAAAVVWIGDDTKIQGALHSDLSAFHATREALAENGASKPFTGNRVHTVHSSTTTAPARALWVPREAGSRVVAHRGASHEFPEQTLAAYREALRQGADGLECDIRLTKDGQLVCIHDKRIDRTSNGTGRVRDMTLAELQQFDFGSQHPSRELGDAQGDTGILTLDALLQLVKDHDQPVTLFIEAKEHGGRLERELVALLDRHGLLNPASADQSRVAVISFYPDAIWRVHLAAPELPTVLLGSAARHLATTVGATAIGPSIKALRANPEMVDIAARQGLTTYCWTVNDESDVQFARDLGVGFIATDHPGRTNSLLRGEPTEPAAHSSTIETDTPANDVAVQSTTDARTAKAVADEALARRIPPVRPDELRHPLGSMEEARARASNNAAWWDGLNEDQHEALIKWYPQHIGNAEGIPAVARNDANHLVLQQLRDRADQVQAKFDEGVRTSRAERKFLRQVNQLDLALRKASADAKRAGVDGPLLLAFDPAEFGGDGRAVLSFGEDPYKADSVSWHVPGVRTTMHSFFGFHTGSALHHLQSTLAENPTKSQASIAWIGYDTPSGWKLLRAAGAKLARTGGDILYSDITAFNAARDTLAGDGSHFTDNHVFGHSYGSTTTGYAGREARHASEIRTVSLIGSPGAGPVRHASEFGIGAENVFVASSSRDMITALGGRTSGSDGRIFGRGLGIDPAMDSFGAQRIAAEFSVGRNQLVTAGTHLAYYLDTDTGTQVRSESAANLGRIAADRHDKLIFEAHRTVDGWRTIEPAAHRSDHRIWNTPWRSDRDCAHGVADELSSIYGRDFHIAEAATRAGVRARSLFEAARSRAEFATYAEVAERLTQLGDGSSAVLASRWAGGRNGGHAYLAVNEGGHIHLYDPHTRQRSGWPPHWGENAVSRTVVGYLAPHGNPVHPLSLDASLQLDAADAVGRVQGHPADADFIRRQADYRAQDQTDRHVDTRYADPLGDVVDNPSQARINQLAEDLSGTYGPYRIQLEGELVNDEVMLTGRIFNGDTEIGTIQRSFYRDNQGHLVAYHSGLVIKEEFSHLRGQGFSKALTSELERYYVHSGVDRIALHTHDQGGYAWARRGFTWDPNPRNLQKSFDAIKVSANRLRDQLGPEARAALDDIVRQLDPKNPRLPEPIDVANLATRDEPELGRRLLDGLGLRRDGSGLDLVRYLPRDVSGDATPQSHSGFGTRLKRLLGLGGDSQADQDCAHVAADELSTMYGRDIRVAASRSHTGTPAWALFEAVGSRAEFATYDDVARRLDQLGDGSSAVLASRWAGGRYGGHAYLAVNEGGQIRLYDPHTRQRSDWPPHWGQDAVTHTAVGYLDADGNPVHPLTDVPLQLQLDAADMVGDVKGHPSDPDFLRRQQEYRAEDPTTRRVDARYADPLGELVDSASSAGAARLAEDLSGNYGPYRVELDGYKVRGSGIGPDGDVLEGDGQVLILEGPVRRGEDEVGNFSWTFYRDGEGNLVAHYEMHAGENLGGRELSQALISELLPYYMRAGVDRITSTTIGRGAYAAVDLGHTWDPDPDKLHVSVENVRRSAFSLRDRVGGEARRVLDRTVQRLEPEHPRLPEPIDLANLFTFDEPELGRRLLEDTDLINDGTGLHYVQYLWNARLQSGQDCAHWVAEVLTDRYGIPVQLNVPPSESGVPARAIFEAVGSRAEFATYAEISELLFQMRPGRPGEPGPAAIVVSSWAGGASRGGHAYLAVYDGGEIYLLDPFTGERSGWPPYWGEDAVSRIAVGFLDADGRPVQQLDGSPGQLAAADAIGDVKGHPTEPNPAGSQDDYRTQDQAIRRVDTRYAEPLGDVVDNLDQQQVHQLADDLSGIYGPYRVEMFRAQISTADEVIIGGAILSGDEEVGFVQRTFHRDARGNLVVHDDVVDIPDKQFRFKGFSKALTDQLESYYMRSGVDRIEMRTEQDGGHAWARRGFTWDPDPRRLRQSLDSIKESASLLRDRVGPEAQAVLDEVVQRLNPARPDLPEPIDLATLSTPDVPDLGRQLLTDTMWYGVKYLRAGATDTSSPDIPLRLETVVALPEPVSELELPDYPPGTLSDAEASTVYAHGEQRMRELNDEFIRVGVSAEDRARVLSELRNSLRAWTRDLMSNRATAEFLAANESNPSFEDLVARHEESGLVGDAVYEAIVESATHSRYAPGTLSDVETTTVYSDFELRLRELNEQLARDGVSVEERARLLSDLRSSLRAWTRELMSNRAGEDWLAANESNPAFEDLVARNEAKGLVGDAIYEAIIYSATHSHYGAGTLSNAETRTVYTTFELRMREVSEQLLRDGVGLEDRARTLYDLRASIRTWTRALMADRDTADYLTANEPNPTFEDLVERQRAKGRVGDEIYEAIIASATRSRASVNESLGIDPENPPELPPMRGPADNE